MQQAHTKNSMRVSVSMSEHACITVVWMVSYGFARSTSRSSAVCHRSLAALLRSVRRPEVVVPPTVTVDVWKLTPKLKLFPEVARAAKIKLAARECEKTGRERAVSEGEKKVPDQRNESYV